MSGEEEYREEKEDGYDCWIQSNLECSGCEAAVPCPEVTEAEGPGHGSNYHRELRITVHVMWSLTDPQRRHDFANIWSFFLLLLHFCLSVWKVFENGIFLFQLIPLSPYLYRVLRLEYTSTLDTLGYLCVCVLTTLHTEKARGTFVFNLSVLGCCFVFLCKLCFMCTVLTQSIHFSIKRWLFAVDVQCFAGFVKGLVVSVYHFKDSAFATSQD